MNRVKVYQLGGAKAGWLAPLILMLLGLLGGLLAMLLLMLGTAFWIGRTALRLVLPESAGAAARRPLAGQGAPLGWTLLKNLLFKGRTSADAKAEAEEPQAWRSKFDSPADPSARESETTSETATGSPGEKTFADEVPAGDTPTDKPRTITLERDRSGIWRH